MHALHKLLLFHVLTSLGRDALGGKIINGRKALKNSLQYMVSLQNSRGEHVCGGFLISEDFVLTAAHCDDCRSLAKVVLGTHDLRAGGIEKSIGKLCKYQAYHHDMEGNPVNDIMLLKLSEKVRLDNSVQTIQLPTPEMIMRENENCQVAGWGKTSSNGTSVDELQVVDVSTINWKVCKQQWDYRIPDNVICAGGYGTTKGACQGDSGGPLVCNGKAVGIVSFNMAGFCAYPNFPNVYTDISKYLHSINDILKTKNC